MNKMAEYTRGRIDGMEFALKIAKNDGIEELEREIIQRGRTGIHSGLTRKETEQLVEKLKGQITEVFIILTVASMHDVYGFGRIRAKRVVDKILEGAHYLSNDMATWGDYINAIKENMGMTFDIEWVD